MSNKSKLIQQFHAALSSHGLNDKESKREMVYEVSAGRVTSSAELHESELQTLINRLNGTKAAPAPKESTENALRRRIISKFREMGYSVYNDEKMKMVADMQRIEETVEGKWKKNLNDYTVEELTKMVAVLEKEWLPNYYKNKNKKNG